MEGNALTLANLWIAFGVAMFVYILGTFTALLIAVITSKSTTEDIMSGVSGMVISSMNADPAIRFKPFDIKKARTFYVNDDLAAYYQFFSLVCMLAMFIISMIMLATSRGIAIDANRMSLLVGGVLSMLIPIPSMYIFKFMCDQHPSERGEIEFHIEVLDTLDEKIKEISLQQQALQQQQQQQQSVNQDPPQNVDNSDKERTAHILSGLEEMVSYLRLQQEYLPLLNKAIALLIIQEGDDVYSPYLVNWWNRIFSSNIFNKIYLLSLAKKPITVDNPHGLKLMIEDMIRRHKFAFTQSPAAVHIEQLRAYIEIVEAEMNKV